MSCSVERRKEHALSGAPVGVCTLGRRHGTHFQLIHDGTLLTTVTLIELHFCICMEEFSGICYTNTNHKPSYTHIILSFIYQPERIAIKGTYDNFYNGPACLSCIFAPLSQKSFLPVHRTSQLSPLSPASELKS